MNIYKYESAFGAGDITTRPMRRAIGEWFDLYYYAAPDDNRDPCQRIAYTVVSKLVRSVFGEYKLQIPGTFGKNLSAELNSIKEKALQLALIGGECYLKPCPQSAGFSFTLMDRTQVLVFGRNAAGEPVDMGCVEQSVRGQYYYTLLERRRLNNEGLLVLENALYRSRTPDHLGVRVKLTEHPDYQNLAERYVFPQPVGLGLVRLKTPMFNCVDGSSDGVSVYAAAAGLIRNIDENEAQLAGEFRRGQSRVFLSSDLLRDKQLQDHLFVGLDEDPEHVGMEIFAPQLREQSFLARKQEYLRNVESVIGLKRGMLSDANVEDRTATEISASAGEFNLTVIDFQQVWSKCVEQTYALCRVLGALYGMQVGAQETVTIDWGNGTLYDEDKLWAAYVQMVDKGLLRPEIALGWRFNMRAETEEDFAAIRSKLMPTAVENG